MKLEIKNRHIPVTERETLVSGTVNVYTAEFFFDSAGTATPPWITAERTEKIVGDTTGEET